MFFIWDIKYYLKIYLFLVEKRGKRNSKLLFKVVSLYGIRGYGGS